MTHHLSVTCSRVLAAAAVVCANASTFGIGCGRIDAGSTPSDSAVVESETMDDGIDGIDVQDGFADAAPDAADALDAMSDVVETSPCGDTDCLPTEVCVRTRTYLGTQGCPTETGTCSWPEIDDAGHCTEILDAPGCASDYTYQCVDRHGCTVQDGSCQLYGPSPPCNPGYVHTNLCGTDCYNPRYRSICESVSSDLVSCGCVL